MSHIIPAVVTDKKLAANAGKFFWRHQLTNEAKVSVLSPARFCLLNKWYDVVEFNVSLDAV